MNPTDHTQQCRQIRAVPAGFWAAFKARLTDRCSAHIAACPRCQKRLAKVGRVELALCLMRNQPHSTGLLAQANTAALKYIKRSLRQSPSADRLRKGAGEPDRLEKSVPVLERLINVAACLFIILMIRTGLSSKMFEIQDQGTKVMENYYARNLDSDLFEDVFGQPPDCHA